jgi:hypothetical protein
MVEIVVNAFNGAVTPTAATAAFTAADASAELQVSLLDFQNMFSIQTPDNLADAVNTSNIRYYVDTAQTAHDYSLFSATASKKVNAALAEVVLNAAAAADSAGNEFATGGLGVVNDYMRNLAAQKLGSPYLTNLFTNEFTVQASIVAACKVVNTNIKNKLIALNLTSTDEELVADASGVKFAPDTYTDSDNICRVLFQALYAQAPERFNQVDASGAPTFSSAFAREPLPFVDGDSIVFTVTMDNSAQDSGGVGWAAAGSVTDRRYKIRLILKASPANACADALASTFSSSI